MRERGSVAPGEPAHRVTADVSTFLGRHVRGQNLGRTAFAARINLRRLSDLRACDLRVCDAHRVDVLSARSRGRDVD
jgi:hypothetical protein